VINIFIYDDNKERLAHIINAIKSEFIKVNYNVDILRTPEAALEKLKKHPFHYDVFVIPLCADGKSHLADYIRETQEDLISAVIFTADAEEGISLESALSHSIYRPSGYCSSAAELISILYKIFTTLKPKRHSLLVKAKQTIQKVNYRENEYFENVGKTIILNLTNGTKIEWKGTFETVYQALPKRIFIKCHQSFIVNINYINELKKHERLIIMKSGKQIEISRSRLQETEQKFISNSDNVIFSKNQII
jgi:DNA-binding LytR/AlgR family response regulator